ncbi:transcription initiation factor IIE subunit beta [Belonocnema kinseyi]|uniref:transcription initiation factor IIE subunit beta n=1 Tax=Belonocnema kinseyi TaxID=2817044 RepID=UPI00143D0BEB|nr:transcription initiation factor IIE subunit beta [Belonocnema kinseyi]
MDPALLRERELFKKRALTTPTVEKKKKETQKEPRDEPKKKPKPSSVSQPTKLNVVNYKSSAGSSQYKFGVLAKIVKHMKARHQDGDDHPLTLDEILDETNQLDVVPKVRLWLQTEALLKNPKIEVTQDNRFLFKAMFRIKDKKSLMRLLKQHDLKGHGGIFLEDIQESLPHCEKHLKSLQNEIIVINRPDKKKVIFYNDKSTAIIFDEIWQNLWRASAVDAMDDQKIEENLEKQGIKSMQHHGVKKPMPIKRKKANTKRKQFKKPRDNEHLAGVLENYETSK